MSVDKFGRGRRYVKGTSSGSSLTQMNKTYLRRDGTNTAIGTINMTGNTLTNVSSPVNDHDAANKDYVDENAGISKNGGVMTGNLIISAAGDNDRVLGCADLIRNRHFAIRLGTTTNRLHYTFSREPVVMDTDHGFLVKARNERVCQFGTPDNPIEIIIDKNIRMNDNRITNLMQPTLPHEVANKLYVDRKPRKILQGYVPDLRSNTHRPNDQFGFVVTASSNLGAYYHPANAFNNLYSSSVRRGSNGEWATNNISTNFWIQVKCPDPVLLWRIALRGRDSNDQKIYNWRLEGSNDGETYTTLLEPPNPTFIGREIQYFPIETQNKFNTFRLFCLEAEPDKPGLSYMQLYVYSE